MQQRKEITIADKRIVAKELSVRQIMDFGEDMAGSGENIAGAVNTFSEKWLDKLVEGIGLEELKDMYPSELKVLTEALKEVNSVFLATWEWVGIKDIVIKAIKKDFESSLLALSEQDT